MTAMPDAIMQIREEFAKNHLYGWYCWLQGYHDALDEADFALCDVYLDEINNGYALWPEEATRLDELRDVRLFHEKGDKGFSDYYEHLQEEIGDLHIAEAARVNLRMGMIRQYRGATSVSSSELADAYKDYQRSLNYWKAKADQRATMLVEALLQTLDEQKKSGQLGTIFLHYWGACTDGKIEPLQEVRDLAVKILAGEDWRRGRIALAAMERLRENDIVAVGLTSRAEQTALAAIAALRKQDIRHVETHLINALQSSSWVVRWQAAIALRQASSNAVDELVKRLRTPEEDILVRIAAAHALGKVGHSKDIPQLQVVAVRANPTVDFDITMEDNNGERLSTAVDNAIKEIEERERIEVLEPLPPRPLSTPPLPRSVRRKYVVTQTLVALAAWITGAIVLGLVNVDMAIGYMLYALFVQGIIEFFVAPGNFYADKPCHTNWRKVSLNQWPIGPSPGFHSGVNLHLMYLPLPIFPLIIYPYLLVHAFSWWLLLALLLAPILVLIYYFIRESSIYQNACPYCPAREQCARRKNLSSAFPSALQ